MSVCVVTQCELTGGEVRGGEGEGRALPLTLCSPNVWPHGGLTTSLTVMSLIMLKNFPVYNSVQGRYESSQTESGKNHFRAEFGAVSSCVKFLLPLQGEPF